MAIFNVAFEAHFIIVFIIPFRTYTIVARLNVALGADTLPFIIALGSNHEGFHAFRAHVISFAQIAVRNVAVNTGVVVFCGQVWANTGSFNNVIGLIVAYTFARCFVNHEGFIALVAEVIVRALQAPSYIAVITCSFEISLSFITYAGIIL